MTVDEAMARLEIERLLVIYCRAADRGDRDAMRSVYHPDSTEEHGPFSGTGYEWIDHLLSTPGLPDDRRQHNLTNIYVEVSGDHAISESYVLAIYSRPPQGAVSDPRTLDLFGGRYLDDLERRQGRWGIVHRRVLHDWSHVGIPVVPWPGVEAFPVGTADEADLAQASFADFRKTTG